MISTGLNAADFAVYEAALRKDHAFKASVNVLDMDQNVVAVAGGKVTGGQVDIDSSQDVERSCTVDVSDPGNELMLLGTPSQAPDWAHLMVQIIYSVWVSDLGRWVNVPIFTGPITGCSPTDGGVTITGAGKESLITVGTNRTYNYGSGWKRTDIIVDALRTNGERFLNITSWSAKTSSAVVIGPKDSVWSPLKNQARQLSDSTNYPWLGYDGRGYAVLKSHSKNVVWSFERENGTLLNNPSVTPDLSNAVNLVVATNQTSGKVVAQSRAPKAHPLSPESLGRAGAPRYLPQYLDTDLTGDAAQALTDNALSAGLTAGTDVSFDCMVVPHLEPRDVSSVNPGKWSWNFQLNKFTIPLTNDKMTIGRNLQVAPTNRRRTIVRRSA